MNNYNSVSGMLEINKFIEEIVENNYCPILILDIDDTCLSSQFGKKFVDENVCVLADYIYGISPNNLWFLTARNHEYKNKTQHNLNKSGLLHKGQYIKYNLIHSPYDESNKATKGKTLINSIMTNIPYNENNWYIIVDDDLEQIENMYDEMSKQKYNYTLFHFHK